MSNRSPLINPGAANAVAIAAWQHAQYSVGLGPIPGGVGFLPGSPLAKLSALQLDAQAQVQAQQARNGWLNNWVPLGLSPVSWFGAPVQQPTPDQILEGLKKIQNPVLAINLALAQLQNVDTRTPEGRASAAKLLEFVIALLQQVEDEGQDATGDKPVDQATEKTFHHLSKQLRHAAERMDPSYGQRAAHREVQMNGVAATKGVAGSTGQVPWISQFSLARPSVACYRASVMMAERGGAHVLGPEARIQIGVSKDRAGAVTVNPAAAKAGQDYIDNELANGRPVVVGVSHSGGHHNVDDLTDHFVCVTSRGIDEKGRVYYTFNDPGTRDAKAGSDTNRNNRFLVDSSTGKLYQEGHGPVSGRSYDVTMVRKNAESRS